jgi:hypothetical protein
MSLLNNITRGPIVRPHFIGLYGVGGVGKSSFAAAAPATTNWGRRVDLGFIGLEAVSAKSFLSGHSSPFAFHCINTAAATAIAGGLFVFFRATASTSATASAPIKVTRDRFIEAKPRTLSRAKAEISGFNSYV